MGKKKNVVFVFTDQQRFDTLRVYGNEKLKMPNLNRLSEQSVVFRRAYVTQPVCTPSRGSILSGLYPHNHGSIENNTPLRDDVFTLPQLIADEDYRSAYIGKWHLGDEVVKQHGFDEWISVEDNYRKYYSSAEYDELRSDYYHFLKQHGFQPDRETEDGRGYFSREFSTHLPEQFSKPAFQANETIRFISENKDRPFIAYVSILEPHPPYSSAYDDLYDPEEIDLPPLFHDQHGEDTPLKYRFSTRYYREVGRQFPMKDEKTWRKLIARYMGACTLVDKYVGKIWEAIKDNGLEEDTIFVFTSDHGEMMGDFRMLQKYVMYEAATRVPLLMKVPGIAEQRIIEPPVSQVDLIPTLLELMGKESKQTFDGKSLASVVMGDEVLEENEVFIEWNGDEGEDKWFANYRDDEQWGKRINEVYGSAVRTIVTSDGWKMSLTESGEGELYQLNDDPWERNNLYFDAKYAAKKEELYEKIIQWQNKTKDAVKLKK